MLHMFLDNDCSIRVYQWLILFSYCDGIISVTYYAVMLAYVIVWHVPSYKMHIEPTCTVPTVKHANQDTWKYDHLYNPHT